MTLTMLPPDQPDQHDDAAERYLARLAPSSIAAERSRLEQVARWLVNMPDAPRLGAAAFSGRRRLHLDLTRIGWSTVTPEDAQRVRQAALGSHRSRRSAASMLTALRGVLRASSIDRGVLWHVERVLRVDQQHDGAGRSVRQVISEWNADEQAERDSSLAHDGHEAAGSW